MRRGFVFFVWELRGADRLSVTHMTIDACAHISRRFKKD